jgi:hypothetical protein
LRKEKNKIEDPRNPKKIKHNLTPLMIYGILMFVLQIRTKNLPAIWLIIAIVSLSMAPKSLFGMFFGVKSVPSVK